MEGLLSMGPTQSSFHMESLHLVTQKDSFDFNASLWLAGGAWAGEATPVKESNSFLLHKGHEG